jgi:hypothetical protein
MFNNKNRAKNKLKKCIAKKEYIINPVKLVFYQAYTGLYFIQVKLVFLPSLYWVILYPGETG